MKTIKDLRAEIKGIADTIQAGDLKPAQETRLRNRIKFLNTCIKYIETNPSEDFLQAEISRVGKVIELRMSGFKMEPENIDSTSYRKIKREYENMYEIPKLKTQVETLKFLSA